MAKNTSARIAEYVTQVFMILFKKNFLKVLHDEMVEDYMDIFEEIYEKELINPYAGRVRDDDYTDPFYLKDEVVDYVYTSMQEAVKNATFDNDKFSIKGVSGAPWASSPGRKETDEIRLFYFYMMGTPGEYVVLGEKEYATMGSGSGDAWGRFGTVHMLPMHKYVEMYKKNNGGSRGWPSPQSIRHPFSGKKPVRIFEEAQAQIMQKDSYYIKKAINLTLKS